MALSKITNASVADNAVHGRRNLIINGAMQISQRGTDINDISGDTAYNADRFRTRDYGGNGTYDYDQSGNIPDSTFNKSLKLTCKSAATDIGTFGYSLEQIIEGYNIAQLHLGRSTAKPITVSFWVKSSIAGTYSTGLRTTLGEFSFTTEFTLLANTWTYVTYTAPALTTTLSSLNEDTNVGLHVDIIGLGAQTSKIASTLDAWEAGNKVFSSNQTAWMSNAGATLNVTGVQLEVGDASPFEHRSYGEELALCQRYYYQLAKSGAGSEIVIAGATSGGTNFSAYMPLVMRSSPTITWPTSSGVRQSNQAFNVNSWQSIHHPDGTFTLNATLSSAATANTASFAYSFQNNISFDSEL
jgi:hypothetical protein